MDAATADAVVISGIDALELRALRKALPAESLNVPASKLAPSQHGDLGATTAVVVVSALAVKAIAAWLVKNRGRTRATLTRTVTRVDGSVEALTYSVESSTSSSDAAVIQQLTAALKIDPSTLR